MNPRRVLGAVPTRGQVGWGTVARLQEIRDANPFLPPIHYEAGHLSAGLVKRRIVDRFLSWDYDVLFIVDDDVIPPSELLSMADLIERGDADIVGCPMLMFNPAVAPTIVPAVFRRNGNGYDVVSEPGEVVACDLVSSGCTAFSRHALEQLRDAFGEAYVDGEIVSDDVVVCQRARELGLRIMADFRIAADHWTTVSLAALLVGARQAGSLV